MGDFCSIIECLVHEDESDKFLDEYFKKQTLEDFEDFNKQITKQSREHQEKVELSIID